MKVVFMGTPEFAVPALNLLVEKYDVTAVISQPDKPKGRGKTLQHTPVKAVALAHDIQVYQPVKIKDPEFVKKLSLIEADIFVVVAYGQILTKEILEMPKYGCINIHGSLLPKYRGPAPVHWAVINGEKNTGVTIMYMDEGLDTGDIILQKEIPITKEHTSGTLYEALSHLGAQALIEALDQIEKGTAKRQKQEDSLSTYAPLLNKEMGHIDWRKKSDEIINLIKGLDPWPSAYTYMEDGCVLKVWLAEKSETDYEGVPGEVVYIDNKAGIYVKTGDGTLIIRELQVSKKRRMCCNDFLCGNLLCCHTILK